MNYNLSNIAIYLILGVLLVLYIIISISDRTHKNFVKKRMTMVIGLAMILFGIILSLIYFV